MERRYEEILDRALDGAVLKGSRIGLTFGGSQMIVQFCLGFVFWAGALILRDNPGEVSLLDIMSVVSLVIYAGWYGGNTFYLCS